MNKKAQNKISIFPIILVLSLVFLLAIPLIDFTPDTPADAITTSNRSVEFWTNITEANLQNVTWNWNGTNYSIYDNNLVLAYNFNNLSSLGENDTLVYDISGNGNNGTVQGTFINITARTNGNYGGAYQSDGTDGSVEISNRTITNASTQFSIAFWIKPNECTKTAFTRIINKGDVVAGTPQSGWEFFLDTNERVGFGMNNQSGSTNTNSQLTNCNEGVWTQIVGTFNNTEKKLYKNGELHDTDTLNFNNFTNNDIIYIGRRSSGDNSWFDGSIDEVMIWNTTLSNTTIEQLYYSNLKKFDSDSWQLYINQPTKVNDIDYFSCATNSSGSENCTETRTITKPFNQNITSNFSLSVGEIRNDFYGTNGNIFLSESQFIDTTNDGTLDTASNFTWHREQFINSNMKFFRRDMNLNSIYTNSSDGSVNRSGDMSFHSNMVEWAKDNNIKILYIIDYMPEFLANKSAECTSVNSWKSCTPNNLTQWNNIVLDFINNATNGGEWNSTIELEFWNQPGSGSGFLDSLGRDNITLGTEYVSFYNSTYNAVKDVYPNIPFISMGGEFIRNKNFVNTILSNLTTQMDGVSLHNYGTPWGTAGEQDFEFFDENYHTSIDELLTLCSTYSANCSRILITEWGITGAPGSMGNKKGFLIKNDSTRANEYSMQIGLGYLEMINKYPANVSLQLYQWAERYRYNNTAHYPEYPQKWHMVEEPLLFGGNGEFQPSYNITKNFATYCPAGATVYNSTSTTGDLVSVACKDGDNYNTIVINKGSEAINLSNNFQGTTSYVMDKDTGTLYLTTENSNIGVIEQYEIKYIVTPTFTLTEGTDLTKTAATGESYTSNEIRFINSTNTKKLIASDLVTTENMNVTFNVDSCDNVGTIKYTSDTGAFTETFRKTDYTCSNNQVTLSITGIETATGSNEIEIEYGCNSFTRIGYKLVMLLASIMLLFFVSKFVYDGYTNGNIDVGQLIMLAIAIIVSVILWTASGQNLGASCGVIS